MNPTKLNALPNFWMRFLHPLLEPRSLYKERFLLVFLFSAALALTLKAIPEGAATTFSAARDRRSCCGSWGHPKSRTSASTGCSLTRTKASGVVTHQHRSVLTGRTSDRLKDLLYPNCLEFTSFSYRLLLLNTDLFLLRKKHPSTAWTKLCIQISSLLWWY